MMKDSQETTIIMPLSQFKSAVLMDDASDFDETFGEGKASRVLTLFREALATSTETMEGSPILKLKEKDYSAAWLKVDKQFPLCPGYFLHLSEEKPEPEDKAKYKIDGSFIADEDRGRTVPRVPNWAMLRYALVFKPDAPSHDPFDERSGNGPDATAQSRTTVRGQLMSYSAHTFKYQHRTALHMLLINGRRFRAMRWDRSGVIASEAVDYLKSVRGMKSLLQVLYAFSKFNDQQQGRDTTVVELLPESCGWQRMEAVGAPCDLDLDVREGPVQDASKIHSTFLEEFNLRPRASSATEPYASLDDPSQCCVDNHDDSFHSSQPPILPVFTHVRKLFQQTLLASRPRYVITVRDHLYLVAKPIFEGSGMIGRGTRCYVALEWHTQRLVLLKDTWRPHYLGNEPEGAIIQKLNLEGVSYVPTLIAYEDVCDIVVGGGNMKGEPQETETSNYSPVTGNKQVISSMEDSDEELEGTDANTRGQGRLQQKARRWVPELPSTAEEELEHEDDVGLPPSDVPPEIPAAAVPQDTIPPVAKSKTSRPGRGTKRSQQDVIAEDKRTQGSRLRHLIHTRLVAKDICLSFTEFTSSQQLVRIVLHCATGHEQAFVKCGYLHRDVSAGNILIRPILKPAPDGTLIVYWTGLLSDWELAKCSTLQIPMQPQRTGTWHFISRHLLDHLGAANSVADEVEAFTYVIIYGASRFIMSTLSDVPNFIFEFFESYTLEDGTRRKACPHLKMYATVHGSLATDHGRKPIMFYAGEGAQAAAHPLNTLIKTLLKLFQSRYAVLDYEQFRAPPAAPVPKTPSPFDRQPPPKDLTALFEGDDLVMESPESPLDKLHSSVEQEAPSNPHPQPTREMYEHQQALETHATFLDTLKRFAVRPKMPWPVNDAVPDRCKEEYLPHPPAPPLASGSRKPAKRVRREPTEEAVAGPSNPPGGPSRVTRSRTARDGTLAGLANGPATAEPSAGEGVRVTRSRSRLANAAPGQAVQGDGAQTTGPNAGAGHGAPVARTRSTRGRAGGNTGGNTRANGGRGRGRGSGNASAPSAGQSSGTRRSRK